MSFRIAALMLLAALPAFGQERAEKKAPAARPAPPLEIKGVRPGMPVKDLEALFPGYAKACASGVSCALPESEIKSFGGQPLKQFIVSRKDASVESAVAVLASTGWLPVLAALREKFGLAATGQVVAGKTGTEETYTWRQGDTSLVAHKIGDTMRVEIRMGSAPAAPAKAISTRDAAKDL